MGNAPLSLCLILILVKIYWSIDDVRGGDIAIRFWKDLRENLLRESPEAKVGAEDIVLVEWPVALILTRKV